MLFGKILEKFCWGGENKTLVVTFMTDRNISLDFAKGLCIILMVIGHSGCPYLLGDFIYMFHMPCFFFISGYLLNDKYMTDLKTGLSRKLKETYKPFVKWSVFFLTLNAFFRFLILKESYSVHELIEKTVQILTMSHIERLVGGYWFLISLCIASIISLFALYVLRKYSETVRMIILFIIIICALLFGVLQDFIRIPIPYQFQEKTCMGLAFYLSGYIFRKIKVSYQSLPSIYSGLFLMIPAIAAFFVHWGIDSCVGLQIIPYYFTAICGILGVLCLSSSLPQGRIYDSVAYIGRKTLIILTFHFFAFKIISAVYIFICDLPIQALSEYPVIKSTVGWLWVIYSIFGVCFPLLLQYFFGSVLKKNFMSFGCRTNGS